MNILDTAYTVVALACVTYLWIASEPTVRLRKALGLVPDSPDRWLRAVGRLSECGLCSGFWVGLVFTTDPVLSCVVAVAAELLHRRMCRLTL